MLKNFPDEKYISDRNASFIKRVYFLRQLGVVLCFIPIYSVLQEQSHKKNNDCPVNSECTNLAISCLSSKHDVEGYVEYRKKEYDTRFILGWYLDRLNAS